MASSGRAHTSVSTARATSRSSNGTTRSPIVWVVSWPLPAMITMSPGFGQRDRHPDRRRPIDLDLDTRAVVVGDAGDDLVDDVGGVLGARVVGGHDDEVGEARRRRPHLRPLRAVAIAAGAEHDDDPAAVADQRPGGGDHLLEPVRGVGEVDDDVDRSTGVPAPTVTRSNRPGTASDGPEAGDDRLDADPDRRRGRRRGDGVHHVERAAERHRDALAAPGEGDRRTR